MAEVIHLAGDDGLLEAADRLARAPDAEELVLAVPEGAPVLANPLFLTTLRDLRAGARLVLVTADARGRAFASGVRLPAFASLAAYEQKSVDPTERLERARIAALAEIGRERARRRARLTRLAATGAAALVLLLAIAPSAEITVAADETPLAPLDLQVVAGANGAVSGARLQTQLTPSVSGSATGDHVDTTRATGTVRLQNASTDQLSVPVGFIVSTADGVQFRTTQARQIAPSRLIPFFLSSITAPVEAVQAGTSGNVGAGAIRKTGDQRVYVSNDQPTSGGSEQHTPVVTDADVRAASAALDAAIATAAQEQLARWAGDVARGQIVAGAYAARTVARTANADVVGKQVPTFQLGATVEITSFAVPDGEPRATALRRLGEELRSEHELVPSTVDYRVVSTTVTADGVTWHVTARADERRRLDASALQLALAGQDRAAAAPLLADRGMKLVELRAFPSWWPRLPFLPLRIDVRSGAGASAAR